MQTKEEPKVVYATQYYISTSAERQDEIDFCMAYMLNNMSINHYIILFEDSSVRAAFIDKFMPETRSRILKEMEQSRFNMFTTELLDKGTRPTFDMFMEHIEAYNKHTPSFNILANSDIYIDQLNVELIKNHLEPDEFYGLSRYDINEKGEATLFDRADSQDTFVWYGALKSPIQAPFIIGSPGQDNRLLYLFQQAGYSVVNPSHTIKTYHLHITDIRTYIDKAGNRTIPTVQPPYLLAPPVEIITKP